MLTKNTPALKVYTGAGLQIQRETRLFEWLHPSPADAVATDWPEAEMALVMENFRRLHPVATVWGRDLPGVILRAGLRLGVMAFDGRVMGYVLFTASEGAARIIDLAAVDAQTAVVLLKQLQAAFTRITSIDEPADSPLTPAFDLCGFREFDRQYELAIDFAPA